MATIQKITGIISGFAQLYLIPQNNVLFIAYPNVHIIDPDKNIQPNWAIDTLAINQQPVGDYKLDVFNLNISGFIAGKSDTQAAQLYALSKQRFIAIAKDYQNKTYILGTKEAPLSLHFYESITPVGYNVQLFSKSIHPLREANVIVGQYAPNDPNQPEPPPQNQIFQVGLSGIPDIPSHYLTGGGNYMNGEQAQIHAHTPDVVQGHGWVEFVEWLNATDPFNPSTISSDNPYTFNVTDNITIIARYQAFDPIGL